MSQWTKTEAFQHFGATLHNVRWSWSAQTSDKVVVALWDDLFTGKPPEYGYSDKAKIDEVRRMMGAEYLDRQLGMRDRTRHLIYAQDCLGGVIHVVRARAKDTAQVPREIAECYPVEWRMRITELDRESGALKALQIT